MRECRYILILTISYILAQNCSGIHLIDLPNTQQQGERPFENEFRLMPDRRQFLSTKVTSFTKSVDDQEADTERGSLLRSGKSNDDGGILDYEMDSYIKIKIATLVRQAVHDTERKMKSIQSLKEKHREEGPYRIGFILSMIKKARDVLNELFNVAVKYRDQWKALEQLKIFELVIHTNVDTTNLVRQMVEIHVQHLNATQNEPGRMNRRRVVLLK